MEEVVVISEDQSDALQDLYSQYRRATGDYKLNYRPFYHSSVDLPAFVTWIRATLDDRLLSAVAENRFKLAKDDEDREDCEEQSLEREEQAGQ
jgi:hypothetical protein